MQVLKLIELEWRMCKKSVAALGETLSGLSEALFVGVKEFFLSWKVFGEIDVTIASRIQIKGGHQMVGPEFVATWKENQQS